MAASDKTNYYDISFRASNVTKSDMYKFPKIYFTAGSSIRSTLRKDADSYVYNIEPIIRNENNDPIRPIDGVIKNKITGSTNPKMSWSGIIQYLIDTHENGAYRYDSSIYYAHWFGNTNVGGSAEMNLASNNGQKNYSYVAKQLYTAITNKIAYTATLFGKNTYNHKSDVNYFTDAVPGTNIKVGIREFTIYAQVSDASVSLPEKMTVTFNNAGNVKSSVTINKNNWAKSNTAGTLLKYTVSNTSIGTDCYAFNSEELCQNIWKSNIISNIYTKFYKYSDSSKYSACTTFKPADNTNDLNLLFKKGTFTSGWLDNYSRNYIVYPSNDSAVYNASYPTYACGMSDRAHERFFTNCTIDVYEDSLLYKNNVDSTVINTNTIIIPYGISEDTSSGVHMFGTCQIEADMISVTIDEFNLPDLCNTQFYISDVLLGIAENAAGTTGVQCYLVGNCSYQSSATCLTDIYTVQTIDALNKTANTNGISSNIKVTIPSTAVSSTLGADSSSSGYNSNILNNSNIGYVGNYTAFYTEITPKIQYIENSLQIDGFTADDLNGYLNACMDSGSHTISMNIKNDTGIDIILYPQIFNMNADGTFIDETGLYDNGNESCGNQCQIQFNTKIYDITDSPWNRQLYVVRLNSMSFMSAKLINFNNTDDNWKAGIFTQAEMNKEYNNQVSNGNTEKTDIAENGHNFYKVEAGATVKISVQLKANTTKKAAVFAIGAIALAYTGKSIDDFVGVTRTVKMFNNVNSNLPAFIQLGGVSENESKYIFNTNNSTYGSIDNIINIDDEIKQSESFAGYIILNSKTFEIVMLPKKIVEFGNTQKNDYDKLCEKYNLNNLCITDDCLVYDLSSHFIGHGMKSKFKYLWMSNSSNDISDWIDFNTLSE